MRLSERIFLRNVTKSGLGRSTISMVNIGGKSLLYNLPMNTNTETSDILRVLSGLPTEKVRQVRDFANFLDLQYRKSLEVDESDEWSDEDLRDFSKGSKFSEEMSR